LASPASSVNGCSDAGFILPFIGLLASARAQGGLFYRAAMAAYLLWVGDWQCHASWHGQSLKI
jgi:hypothetical protein